MLLHSNSVPTSLLNTIHHGKANFCLQRMAFGICTWLVYPYVRAWPRVRVSACVCVHVRVCGWGHVQGMVHEPRQCSSTPTLKCEEGEASKRRAAFQRTFADLCCEFHSKGRTFAVKFTAKVCKGCKAHLYHLLGSVGVLEHCLAHVPGGPHIVIASYRGP